MDEGDPPAEVTNLVTGRVSGTVIQARDIGTLTVGAARSRYLGRARQLAPEHLVGRETELADLAAFCNAGDDAPAYVWWLGDAWSGKSALMATFVLHPPPGVRVISFFVTARFGGDDDREAFLETVLEQLAALLGEPRPPANSEVNLHGMLAEAAEVCRRRGERLVLVVDGLDEDQGVGTGPARTRSIAALLPPRPAAGLRVLVAGRPNPPIPFDVPDDHVLRDPAIRRPLEPSPAAKADRIAMGRELDRLLHGSPEERDLVALTIVANGGLSVRDLAELTGTSPREIGGTLGSVASRSFARRPATWRAGTAPEVFLLAHEGLRAAAEAELDDGLLDACRRRLFAWADGYRSRGWPEDTPQYLLQGFFRVLHKCHDLAVMVAYATDPARQERLLDVSGNDVAALNQITTARNALHEEDEPDLVSLIRLAVHQDELTDRNVRIPTRLPAVWAALGRPDHADALLESIPGWRRAFALEVLVRSTAGAGDVDRAEAVAFDVTDSADRTRVLRELGRGMANAGEVDRAVALAESLPEPARTGQLAWLAALADQGRTARAEAMAWTIEDDDQRQRALRDVVGALCGRDAIEDARTVAEKITDGWSRAEATADIVAALCRLGELDQARRLTETIDWFYHWTIAVAALIRAQDDPEDALGVADALGDVYARERVLPAVAGVLGRAGDHDRAWALIDTIVSEDVRYDAVLAWAGETCVTGDVDQAIEMVLRHGPLRSLSGRTKITAQADALTHLAEEMVVRGEPGLARHLAGQAESLARTAAHTWELSMVLAALAKLVCEAGDVRRAETLARMIDPRESPGVAEPLAGLLSSSGDADLAETLILSGTTVRGFKDALIDLIRRAAATGDVDRIGRLVEHARAIEPPPEGGDREAWALVEVLAAAGELDAAQTAAEAIAPGWIRREAFVHLIRAAGAAGDVERAQVLVAGMDEPAFRDRAEVIALVEGLAAGGHLEKAVEVAQEASSSAVFAALVRVVAVRDPHEAVSVADRISAPSHRVRALVAAARATPHARSRFLAEAMRTGSWVRTLPALTGEEKADLLDVVDELNAFRRARPRPPG